MSIAKNIFHAVPECSYSWLTKSTRKYVSCPNCMKKVLNPNYRANKKGFGRAAPLIPTVSNSGSAITLKRNDKK